MFSQDKRLTAVRGKKYLQVAKNRYSGDLGIVPLDFDKDALSYQAKKRTKSSKQGTSDDKEEHLKKDLDADEIEHKINLDFNTDFVEDKIENIFYRQNNNIGNKQKMKMDDNENYLREILNANTNR